MDRFDERKPVHETDETDRHERHEGDEPDAAREGDVLGLSGTDVPKMPGDPTTEYDPESVAQRRARVRAGEEATLAQRDEDLPRGKGATGIDMGAGGSGTDIKP